MAESNSNDKKCPPCDPGLPGWLATFSDMMTLLLTFFVLLLSFSKTEVAKYEAALGSIRNAFGGNVLKYGEVIQKGKSPDDYQNVLDSQEPINPFPIEFLSSEGMLEKYEINRSTKEVLKSMRRDLFEFGLDKDVDIFEVGEGIKVVVKDSIYFKEGSVEAENVPVDIYSKLIKLLTNRDWVVFVQGHASLREASIDGLDAYKLSSMRAEAITRSLIKKGVPAKKITTTFYGDTKPARLEGDISPEDEARNRRVDFIIRKKDLYSEGFRVREKD